MSKKATCESGNILVTEIARSSKKRSNGDREKTPGGRTIAICSSATAAVVGMVLCLVAVLLSAKDGAPGEGDSASTSSTKPAEGSTTNPNGAIRFEVRVDNPPEGELPFLVVPVASGGRGGRDTVLWKFNPKRGVYAGIVRDEYAVLRTPDLVWPEKPRDDVSFVYESFVPTPSTFEAELGTPPILLGVVYAIPHAKIRVVQKISGDITCTWPSQKKNTLYTVCLSHAVDPFGRRRTYPIAVRQTKESSLRMTRSELLCSIEKRHRAYVMMAKDVSRLGGGDVSRIVIDDMEDIDSRTMYTNGRPRSIVFSVSLDVTGRDISGRVVLRASSEPIRVTISDADELKHFMEKRKVGKTEKRDEKE